jgi:hypothetical protein
MARPLKEGLDYFPVDTLFDEKIEVIEAVHGNDGLATILKLWQRAYRTLTGEVDLSTPLFDAIVAKDCNVSLETFTAIIKTAIECKLFDADAFHQRRVLTSNGIKKRIKEIIKKRRNWRGDSDSRGCVPPVDGSPIAPTSDYPSGESGLSPGITRVNWGEKCTNISLLSFDLLSFSLEGMECEEGEILELAQDLRLTAAELLRLRDEIGVDELAYWLVSLNEAAGKNRTKWRKEYQDHNLVLRNWRRRKLEDGFQWLAVEKRFERSKKILTGQFETAAEKRARFEAAEKEKFLKGGK